MKFIASKPKSGFEIKYHADLEVDSAIDSQGKLVPIPAPSLCPKKIKNSVMYEVNLIELFDDLCDEAIKVAQKYHPDESILKLANKWGYIQYKHSRGYNLKWSGLVMRSHANAANSEFFLNSSENEINFSYAKCEYQSWYKLLFYIVPYAKFGKQYIKNKNNLGLDSYLEKLNECIADGVRVEYKKHQRFTYDVIPLNLLAAITLFSQKTRSPKNTKDLGLKTCNYGPCSNKLEMKLGKGRERMYCSNSCKVLMSKYGENGPEEHKTKIGKCAYKGCGKEITIKLGKGRPREYCNSSCRVQQLKM
ncbi:hypothetical protein N9R25_02355 [Gammaproteobacteria bacterium]|nr:hypothetical protein [Gammaproteobacteria bacterium]